MWTLQFDTDGILIEAHGSGMTSTSLRAGSLCCATATSLGIEYSGYTSSELGSVRNRVWIIATSSSEFCHSKGFIRSIEWRFGTLLPCGIGEACRAYPELMG